MTSLVRVAAAAAICAFAVLAASSPLNAQPAAAGAEASATVDVQADARVEATATVDAQAAATAAASTALRDARVIVPMRFGAQLALGLVDDGSLSLNHLGGLAALDVEIAPVDWLALGVRGESFGAWGLGVDADGNGASDADAPNLTSWTVSVGPRLRLFDDPASRDGWRVELGGGFRYVPDGVASDGVFLDVAIARQAGFRGEGDETATEATLELRYRQGVGALADFQAVMLGVGAAFETNLGEGRAADDAPASFRYVLQGEGLLGASLASQGPYDGGTFSGGVGLAFGVPIGAWIEPRVRVDVLHRAGGEGRDPLAELSGLVGLRLRMNEVAPLYVEAHGGYAGAFGTPASVIESGPVIDFGAGFRFAMCRDDHRLSNSAFTLGARGRFGVGDNEGMHALYAVAGFEYGSGSPAFATRCNEPEPEPAPVVTPPQPQTEVTVTTPPPPQTEVTVAPPPPATTTHVQTYAPPEEPSEPFDWPGIRFGIAPMFGLIDVDASISGTGGGAAFPIDVALTPSFSLGGRFSVLEAPDASVDADGDGIRDADLENWTATMLSGGPRLRIWTDADDRQGWEFDAGAGFLWASDLGEDGAFVEVGVTRTAGFASDGIGGGLGLGARAMQGLGDASDFRALLFTMIADLELGAWSPEGEDDSPSRLSYSFGLEAFLGWSLAEQGQLEAGKATSAIGLVFGVPLTEVLEPHVRATLVSRGNGEELDGMGSFAPSGGLRLRFDRFFPIHVEADAGYAMHFGTPAAYVDDGAFAAFGIGTAFPMSCEDDSRIELGVRAQIGLEDDRGFDALMLTTALVYGGGAPRIGANGWWCRRRIAAEARAEEEARRRALEMPAAGRMDVGVGAVGGGGVDVQTGGEVNVGVEVTPPDTTVVVEPPRPPAPVVIEVPLGMSLFGGAIRVDVAGALPIERMRAAGLVDVRIEGPPEVLARVEADLRVEAGRQGVTLGAVTRVATGGAGVRAVITLHDPGSK